jgi:hypothetical protein
MVGKSGKALCETAASDISNSRQARWALSVPEVTRRYKSLLLNVLFKLALCSSFESSCADGLARFRLWQVTYFALPK